MLNIGGSLRRYRGTDGFVKPVPLTDMINMVVRSKHSNLNKQDRTSAIILSILLRKAWILKINFLSLEILDKLENKMKIYFELIISLKGRKQTFPLNNEIFELDPDIPTIKPEIPIIMFSDFLSIGEQIVFTLKIFKQRRFKNKRLTTSRFIMIKGDKNHNQKFTIKKEGFFKINLETLLYYVPK
jgi:hypothetical protein